MAALSGSAASRRRGLFAYPAQSNFSGVQHPLRWIETAHEHGYDVLLDAAAYLPSNRLDLSVVRADDFAFIDRIWADWSPGYDASEDLPKVKECIRDPAHFKAALGYYWGTVRPEPVRVGGMGS